MRTITVFLLAAGYLTASGSFPSGPQVGDKLPDLKAKGVAGPNAEKEFKLHDQVKDGPALIVLVQQFGRPAFRFLRPIDEFAAAKEGLAAHIVWVTGDVDKTEAFLKRAQNSLKLQVPVSICLDGKDGPPTYGLNDKVAVTVLVTKDRKVVANFALTDPNDQDAPKVIEAIKKAIAK
jgi:hypothetical protein